PDAVERHVAGLRGEADQAAKARPAGGQAAPNLCPSRVHGVGKRLCQRVVSAGIDKKHVELRRPLHNANGPIAPVYTRAIQAAAEVLGHKLVIAEAGTESDFEMAFATLVQQRVSALVVPSDGLFNHRPDQLTALALRDSHNLRVA